MTSQSRKVLIWPLPLESKTNNWRLIDKYQWSPWPISFQGKHEFRRLLIKMSSTFCQLCPNQNKSFTNCSDSIRGCEVDWPLGTARGQRQGVNIWTQLFRIFPEQVDSLWWTQTKAVSSGLHWEPGLYQIVNIVTTSDHPPWLRYGHTRHLIWSVQTLIKETHHLIYCITQTTLHSFLNLRFTL